MIRLLTVIAALVAALATAPAALAVNFVVNDNGDAADSDTVLDPNCDTDGDASNGVQVCTLRAAIQQANATAGADVITFTTGGRAPVVATLLPPITGQLTIDGGGNTNVDVSAPPTGSQFDVQAQNSLIKALTISGARGTAVNLASTGDRLDTVFIQGTVGTGVRLANNSQRLDGVHIQGGSTGILVTGSSATIAQAVISSLTGSGIEIDGGGAAVLGSDISGTNDGIRMTGSGATVSGGKITANSGAGVLNLGQNNTVTKVIDYGNGGRAIANDGGANGGIAPPQNLRIGPRRADGSLPLTGNGNGTVELFSGDPSSANAIGYVDSIGSGGDFTYNFPSEPAPGTVFSATLTTPGLGTSEFATVAVPSDVTSPDVRFAKALDTGTVRVDFNEPLDPGSVQPEDFKLSMAGADRQIAAASVTEDGRSVLLTSSGWKPGEAGYVDLAAPGAVADSTGNQILSAPRLRVAAAPGDFVAPLASKLSVTKAICLTRSSKCRRPGMTITFVTPEGGKARMVIKRSNQTVGSRLYGNIVVGKNTLKWNGRLASRKLRAGRYRLLLYVQDAVGNVTDQPPIQLFTVRRVTG